MAPTMGESSTNVPDNGWKLYVAVLVNIIAASLIVIARIATRIAARQLGMDDYLIFVTLALAIGLGLCYIMMVEYGEGKHIYDISPEDMAQLWKWMYASNILLSTAVPLNKVAVLLFYRRIFVSKSFRIGSWTLLVIAALGGFACIFVDIFMFTPVAAGWDIRVAKKGAKHNINLNAVNIYYALYDALVDTAILSLPVPEIMKLHIKTREKFMLVGVFLLGGFVVVASIIAHVTTAQWAHVKDLMYEAWPGIVWGYVEVCVGIICASLPILKGPVSRGLAWVLPQCRRDSDQYYYGDYGSPSNGRVGAKPRQALSGSSVSQRPCSLSEPDEERIIEKAPNRRDDERSNINGSKEGPAATTASHDEIERAVANYA